MLEEVKADYLVLIDYDHKISPDFVRKSASILLNNDENGNWQGIYLAADFGSTVSQARAFYQRISSFQVIQELKNFNSQCNLHLAIRSQNKIHFHSPKNSEHKYFEYWKKDVWDNFGGVLKEKLNDEYLNEYVKKGILIYDQEKKEEVNNDIIVKGYQRINICPAIYVTHHITREKASNLDKNGKLASYLKTRITEVLSILNYPLDSII